MSSKNANRPLILAPTESPPLWLDMSKALSEDQRQRVAPRVKLDDLPAVGAGPKLVLKMEK